MTDTLTFWKITETYSIEIPTIQRDYVQGNNKSIAEDFIKAIYESLTSDTSLSIDFIYGKVSEKGDFIPIDGQQRLTTLYLLHFYIAVKERKISEKSVKDRLKKFRYETRLTTKDFCQIMVDNGDKLNFDGNSVSESIKGSNWYFLIWNNDPSVIAMLKMLDIIHIKFQNVTTNLWDKLVKEDVINFYFIPLENFSLTDELYIKMNARGKPLTKFENFKAFYSIYLKEEEKSKIDNEWLDIFWKLRNQDGTDLSDAENKFYYFMENILLMFHIIINKEFKDVRNYELLKNKYELIDTIKGFSGKISNFLDFIQNYEFKVLDEYYKEKDIFLGILSSNPSYIQRVRFFAFYKFLEKNEFRLEDIDEYKDWMRVTYNLISNTRIDEVEHLFNALKSINDSINYQGKLLDSIADKKNIISFFSRVQLEEEILKAKLIREDSNWKSIIIEAEQQEYLDGQIGFLIDIADQKIEVFKSYLYYFSNIFKASDDYLFERLLLCYGNYFVEKGRKNHTFCNFNKSLRDKNENWRKVFQDSKNRKFLKTLLDDVIKSMENKETAIDIVRLINEKLIDIKDWRKYFIERAEFWRYCTKQQIRYIYCNGSIQSVYLLSKERIYAEYVELYSYYIYFLLSDNCTYEYGKGEDYLPKVHINEEKGNVLLSYDGNNNFKIIIRGTNSIIFEDILVKRGEDNFILPFDRINQFIEHFRGK